jgi:SulP family sulfate permease
MYFTKDRAGGVKAGKEYFFKPALVSILKHGYGLGDFRNDAIAGLTVAIVALPLSMALAIASGVSPERGLYTAIVGGFLVSLLGGSRFQIGGPAGAFIVLVAATVERHGYDGLVLATAMAGLMMLAIGAFRLGTYIKYIPYPVTVGFTAGIAVIIFASQLRDLLGLDLTKEPAAFAPKLTALWSAIGTIKPVTVAISLASIAAIVLIRKYRPHWPGFLIVVIVSAAAATLLNLDVATIGSRFGAVPNALPAPQLPPFGLEKMHAVLPDAIALALLGAIESLLSAVVADGMSGMRHRSNTELMAQGTANIGSVIFGGIPVTGTIARTATNVRSGAKSPISGMLHSIYLLLFMLVAAPLAVYIPLAVLGAVLAVVAWNMAERHEFWALIRTSWADAVVLLVTFLLTIFDDLVTAIGVGVVLGSLLLLHRMAQSVSVDASHPANGAVYDPEIATYPDVMVYRISGVFFFGATAEVSIALDRMGEHPRAVVLDFSEVPLIDTTAVNALAAFVKKFDPTKTKIYLVGLRVELKRALVAAKLHRSVRFATSIDAALARVKPTKPAA